MKQLIIAVDCDDVLTDTLPQVVEDYNKTYSTSLGLEHMYRDVSEVAEVFGVTSEQEAIQRLHAIYRRKGYYEALRPINGAVEAIAELARYCELHVVTGRQSFLEPATHYTLDTYFPGMFRSVVHTNYYRDDSEKDAVHRPKADVCRQLGADILIDDHITHGVDVLQAGVERAILFGNFPWNRQDVLVTGMTRCQNWEEVLGEIERIHAARQ